MQECRRDKLEQESFKRRRTLYCGALRLNVCAMLDLVGTIWKVSDLYIVRHLKAVDDLLLYTCST